MPQKVPEKRTIKLACNGEIHRVSFPGTGAEIYKGLTRHVQSKIGLNRAYSMGYADDDGDFVTISSMPDLDEAFAQLSGSATLKIVINEHNYDILDLDSDGPPPTPTYANRASSSKEKEPSQGSKPSSASVTSRIQMLSQQVAAMEARLKQACDAIEVLKKDRARGN